MLLKYFFLNVSWWTFLIVVDVLIKISLKFIKFTIYQS